MDDLDDIDYDALPGVGGAIEGCDCDMCAEYRREFFAEQAAEQEAEDAARVAAGQKPKRRPKKPKRNNPNVPLASIKLLPEASITLAKAVTMLRDPALLAQVREAKNISHWAMVGPLHADVEIDRICHAGASINIQHGNNQPDPNNRYRYEWRPENNRWQYWNDKTKLWQDERVMLSAKPKKRPFYNFRYMITWTNERVKPEYHGPDGVDYTKVQAKALREFLFWLRNKSHWSRFFVGPKDAKTLFECGCILDLSAPSCVVHMMAVAWRISGEMVEMPEQWWALVQKGVEPHLAFGLAQNVQGFDKTADPNANIEPFASKGHNLIGRSTIQQLARLTSGMLYLTDKKGNLRPARTYYSTSSNYAYRGGSEDDWDDDDEPNGNWLDKFPAALKTCVEKPNVFNPANVTKTYYIRASQFHQLWDSGFVWILTEVGKYMDKRGWKGYG